MCCVLFANCTLMDVKFLLNLGLCCELGYLCIVRLTMHLPQMLQSKISYAYHSTVFPEGTAINKCLP